MKILTCAAAVLVASPVLAQTAVPGYYQSTIDSRIFEVRVRGTLGLDLYDTDGKIQTAMDRKKATEDFKGVTYTLARDCPNNAGKIESTDVTSDRIKMRVEFPNTSMAGDAKGDKTTGCFKFGFVRWQPFVLVRTDPPASSPGLVRAPAEAPAQAAGIPAMPLPPPVPGRPAGEPEPTPTTKAMEARGFKLGVKACQRSGSSVVCRFSLTNTEARRDAQLPASRSRFITIGNRAFDSAEAVLAGVRDRRLARATLLEGLPADAELVFENVPASIREIHLLEIAIWTDAIGEFKVPYPGVLPIRD
jgi:hypothetical protein